MENNKGYLRYFGPIFLAVLASCILVEVFAELLTSNDRSPASMFKLIYLVYAIPVVTFFIAAGAVTKKWQAAIGGLAVFVIIQVMQYFLLDKNQVGKGISPGLMYFLQQLFYLLPHIVFFLLAKTNAKKLPLIVLALIVLQIGDNALYQPQEGFDLLNNAFRTGIHIPGYIFSVLSFTAGMMLRLIVTFELLNFAAGKNKGAQAQIINPGNEYNKVNATILFWVLKSSIYFCIFGCINFLKAFDELFSRYYSSVYSYLKWQYFLSLFFLLFVLLAAAWYLRKFLLEYFATYNFTSRFLYWFILLPGIGFFAWLAMLVDSRKQEQFKEREQSIQSFSASRPDGIITVFIVFLILRLILAFSYNFPWQFIFSLLISAGLYALMVKSRTGFYINFYLSVFVLFIVLLLIFFQSSEEEIFILYPLLLLNSVQLFLIYPAFHFDAFSYISYDEEEKPWEPGQDLF